MTPDFNFCRCPEKVRKLINRPVVSLLGTRVSGTSTEMITQCIYLNHRGTVKGSRDFYHNWTNSILQQVKRKFRKIQMDCSEFHEGLIHLNRKRAFYWPYTLVPDPENFSNFPKLWSLYLVIIKSMTHTPSLGGLSNRFLFCCLLQDLTWILWVELSTLFFCHELSWVLYFFVMSWVEYFSHAVLNSTHDKKRCTHQT